MTEKAKTWFFRSLVGACGTGVIAILGWFAVTHIEMMSTMSSQETYIEELKESNAAQWRVIAENQTTLRDMNVDVGTLERVQLELVLPHFASGHNSSQPAEFEPLAPFTPSIPPTVNSGSDDGDDDEGSEISTERARDYGEEQRYIQQAR